MDLMGSSEGLEHSNVPGRFTWQATQGKLGQAEMWQETTGLQMGLESFAEWCSWELRMDVSVVEKEKATRSNDYWGCNFMFFIKS